MTRWGAFLWSALVAAVCSIVLSFPFGLIVTFPSDLADLKMRSFAFGVTGVVFIFLLAISWAVAGVVSISKAPPRTLMIVSMAVSIMVTVVIVKVAIYFSHP